MQKIMKSPIHDFSFLEGFTDVYIKLILILFLIKAVDMEKNSNTNPGETRGLEQNIRFDLLHAENQKIAKEFYII